MLSEHNELRLKTLFEICHDLDKNDKRIAFTHGAFDMFHYGHLYLLRQTAKLCDYLIVGIESDDNISKYKTYRRPIINETKRLEIISELKCVNAAFINRGELENEWYEELCKQFKIKLITTGGNFGYKDQIRSRADKVKADLKIFKTIDINSTTHIIDCILEKYQTRS